MTEKRWRLIYLIIALAMLCCWVIGIKTGATMHRKDLDSIKATLADKEAGKAISRLLSGEKVGGFTAERTGRIGQYKIKKIKEETNAK